MHVTYKRMSCYDATMTHVAAALSCQTLSEDTKCDKSCCTAAPQSNTAPAAVAVRKVFMPEGLPLFCNPAYADKLLRKSLSMVC